MEVQRTAAETVNAADSGKIRDDSREILVDGGKIPTAMSRLACHHSRNNSTTLLHVASQFGHVAVVRLLLLHGADPSLKYAAFIFMPPPNVMWPAVMGINYF